jgi:hypothetical protein
MRAAALTPLPAVDLESRINVSAPGVECQGAGTLSISVESLQATVQLTDADAAALTRPHSDMNLIPPQYFVRLSDVNGAWAAERALSIENSFSILPGFPSPAEHIFRFYSDVMLPANPSDDGEYYRAIYRGGRVPAQREYHGAPIVLVTLDAENAVQALTLKNRCRPPEHERDAFWLQVALLQGFFVQRLAEQMFDMDGSQWGSLSMVTSLETFSAALSRPYAMRRSILAQATI